VEIHWCFSVLSSALQQVKIQQPNPRRNIDFTERGSLIEIVVLLSGWWLKRWWKNLGRFSALLFLVSFGSLVKWFILCSGFLHDYHCGWNGFVHTLQDDFVEQQVGSCLCVLLCQAFFD
jgi:hypothetical protein